MIFDKKWRRLGDFAAGTLVIREHTDLITTQLIAHVTARDHFAYADRIQPDQVMDMELFTIREYLLRHRKLSIRRRGRLARTIGVPIAQRMGIATSVDYDVFLEETFALTDSPSHRPQPDELA